MGKRSSYVPGTFSWVDLSTTDPDGAAAFYTALFGWDANAAPDGSYTTFHVDGDVVSGVRGVARAAGGGPPRWTSYVSVESADAVVARAPDLGGAVAAEPFDIGDLGRTGGIADPQGAFVAVWQPGTMIGATRVNDVGCLTMNELPTTDVDAARSFYEALFGWTTEPVDTGPGGPVMIAVHNQGSLNASISAAFPGDTAHWRPYFTVESVEAALARAADLGGAGVVGPIPIPDGAIAVLRDPQGAEFALFEGRVDP
jgi:predicted enzyme related to lactoylglutathione lyase